MSSITSCRSNVEARTFPRTCNGRPCRKRRLRTDQKETVVGSDLSSWIHTVGAAADQNDRAGARRDRAAHSSVHLQLWRWMVCQNRESLSRLRSVSLDFGRHSRMPKLGQNVFAGNIKCLLRVLIRSQVCQQSMNKICF